MTDDKIAVTEIILHLSPQITIYVGQHHMVGRVLRPFEMDEVKKKFDHIDNLYSLSVHGILSLAKEFYLELEGHLNKINTKQEL